MQHALINAVMAIVRFFRNPIPFALLCVLLLIFWIFRGGELTRGTTVRTQAESALQELAALDPKAAAAMAKIADEKQRDALLVGVYSTRADGRRHALLADMAAETETVNALPYRARLAALGLEKMDLRGDEQRAAFFSSYGAAMETLALASDWSGIASHMTLLEQAARDPTVWPLVKDDPLALVIWSRVTDPTLLEFYHRNRDWLADPLASPELARLAPGWTLESALQKYAQHEQVLRSAVVDGGLGVFALALMWSHGTLVDTANKQFALDPTETLSVIYMNPDTFGPVEGDTRWVGEQASWMATIARQHPVVWFAAGMTPLALRLHRDAPGVSGEILERYGADDIGVLLYDRFSGTDQISAAATAIARFGDVAIYVFSRYSDPQFAEQLGRFLVDPDIGIRAVPFIVQFGDESFTRLNDDKGWAARYFEPDGSPRKDNMDWVQYVPMGTPFIVVSNWVKGYPNEWSELGWAALDVATLPLAVKSLATPAKGMGAARSKTDWLQAGKQESRAVPALARSEVKNNWSHSLDAYRSGAAKGAGQMTRLREVAKDLAVVSVDSSRGLPKSATEFALRVRLGTEKAMSAWRVVDPRTKVLIYRGMLATVMYIDITGRTLPNLDQIAKGVGGLLGKAASGAVVLAGEALSASLSSFTDELTDSNQPFRQGLYWLVSALLAGGAAFFTWRAVQARRGSFFVRR
jgi:hypothetical protein